MRRTSWKIGEGEEKTDYSGALQNNKNMNKEWGRDDVRVRVSKVKRVKRQCGVGELSVKCRGSINKNSARGYEAELAAASSHWIHIKELRYKSTSWILHVELEEELGGLSLMCCKSAIIDCIIVIQRTQRTDGMGEEKRKKAVAQRPHLQAFARGCIFDLANKH